MCFTNITGISGTVFSEIWAKNGRFWPKITKKWPKIGLFGTHFRPCGSLKKVK